MSFNMSASEAYNYGQEPSLGQCDNCGTIIDSYKRFCSPECRESYGTIESLDALHDRIQGLAGPLAAYCEKAA